MPTDRFQTRRQGLLEKLRDVSADALLVSNVTNVTYLTGFTGDSSYLLLGPDVERLISDTRYSEQIAEECPGLETYIRDAREEIHVSAGKVVKEQRLKTVGFESDSVTVGLLEKLRQEARSVAWTPTETLVEALREIKDDAEIAEIRRAIDLAQRGFRFFTAMLTPDMTEKQAAHELEHAIRRFGGEGVAFDSIVAVGDRAALPHYRPSNRRIQEAEFVLLDWGALSSGGYRSDLTRVISTAKIRPELEKVYRVVLSAQLAAIGEMAPGVDCKDVDAAARGVIEQAGYGDHFGHGLGHGIGLDIHEGPRMSPISKAVLQPGMVVTVEPGVYLPGWGGVRIEDDVLITEAGCEVLSSVPKHPDEIPSV
ncbi:MAG: M24 family metallopeptidase [Planctomycetaceae bacterium]